MVHVFRRCCLSYATSHGNSSVLLKGILSILVAFVAPRSLPAQDRLLPVIQFNRLTTADGLPSNEIRSNVLRDHQGFIWVGTENGLARYDGYTCKVYREFRNPDNALVLFIDSRGRFWVGPYSGGPSLYDPARDRFVHFWQRRNDSLWVHASYISSIYEDDSGVLWFATDDDIVSLDLGSARSETDVDSVLLHARFRIIPFRGYKVGATDVARWDDSSVIIGSAGGLFVVNSHTGMISRPRLPGVAGTTLDTVYSTLFRESPTRLWIGTSSQGLYRFDQRSGMLTGYHKKPQGGRIRDLEQDRNGTIWVATDDRLDMFDPVSGTYNDYIPGSAAPGKSTWTRMSVDATGTLWVTTADNGVYFVTAASRRFPHFALRDPTGLPVEMETIDLWPDGSYWIGASGKVVQIRMTDLKILRTVHLFKGDKGEYGRTGVWASCNDGKGTLWFGTWGRGLFSFEPLSGHVRNFLFSRQLPDLAVKEDVCRSLVAATRDTLWIAAYNDQLISFDTGLHTFSSIPYNIKGQVSHLMRDRSGKIWVSDEYLGVFVVDPSTRRSTLLSDDSTNNNPQGNLHPQVAYQDPAGTIWIGGPRLYRWEPETKSFVHVVNEVFEGASVALPLGNDLNGKLWVDYAGRGVGILDPAAGTFTNFDDCDGLSHPLSMTSLQDGRTLLLSSGGLTIVHPTSLAKPEIAPPLVFTSVSINDTTALPGTRLNAKSTLHLSYDENVLEFSFAAISPGMAHRISYLFRLEGLEASWVNPGERRRVRYSGLGPGDYIFRVKAVNTFGRWPDQEISLAISIAPPWWRTWWAYSLSALLFFGLLSAGYRVRLRQLSLEQRAEMEHFKAAHYAEVDQLKSKFFANISHEFRTPLTLILGPIEKWKERLRAEESKSGLAPMQPPVTSVTGTTPYWDELQEDLSVAERNARRLLRLVNQLLDLSKLEAGAMKLRATPMNIVPLIRGIAYSFESSAGLKQIGLNVLVAPEEIIVYCDRDMVEKILTNLLSNAFKFTPGGGKVEVQVCVSRPPSFSITRPRKAQRGRAGESVAISVSDTGIGIPADQLDRVFDRFYQLDASQTREHEGSGLGLALVKELVELHHGMIQVNSGVGRGTTFVVLLPLGRDHLKDEEIVEVTSAVEPATLKELPADAESRAEITEEQGKSLSANDLRPIILVIEDNPDLRAYMRSFLVTWYRVLEAPDGLAGIERAQEAVPDLVISDVMMPKMDGYELCRVLKSDEKTSHVPIILLTAKAGQEDKIEGLETGADDYLTKPFDAKELVTRVKKLIELRRKLRERFSKSQVLKPGEIAVTSMDDAFLQKVMAVVESHIADENFSVEQMGKEVGMSRSQIHRKLTALTGQSASDFTRYIRLHRAMEMLKKNAGTVSEIAYAVGFSSVSYFTKCFRKQFDVLPSEVKKT